MLPGIRAELEALRRRHSAALELMGERDEEVMTNFLLCGNLNRLTCGRKAQCLLLPLFILVLCTEVDSDFVGLILLLLF